MSWYIWSHIISWLFIRCHIHFIGVAVDFVGIAAGKGCGDAVNFIATILINTLIIGIVDDIICEKALFTAVRTDADASATAAAMTVITGVVVVVAIDAVIIIIIICP